MCVCSVLIRTYAAPVCASGGIAEEKVFPAGYCYLVDSTTSALYNCDGSVSLFFGSVTCSGNASLIMSTTSANNACLAVTNGNGLAVDYSCNDNTKTVTPTAWITITGYNDPTCSLPSSGWLSYACGVCSPLSPDVYYKLTCSQESAAINYVFANYTSSD